MTPGARASAAIDVLGDMFRHHRPAKQALADWGRSHRFAGSTDRAAIGNIVFDVLRRKASLAWRMDDASPKALVLGWLAFIAGNDVAAIERMGRERHGFGALSKAERERLKNPPAIEEAPAWVRAEVPQWLFPALRETFGEEAVAAGQALAERAALDIRANTLLTTRERLTEELARHGPEPTRYSPWGLRFHENEKGRLPHLTAELSFARGHFEIQDEGSQIAAALCHAEPGERVLDLCAGGGGKTLALAAMMKNEGEIVAHDAELERLSRMVARIRRAEVRNVTLIAPHERGRLEAMRERFDLVLIDAPCSGTGTWRRHPDAKWRLRPQSLRRHLKIQRQLLAEAAEFVRPGGRLVYATCSVLRQENRAQVQAFLTAHAGFREENWRAHAALLTSLPAAEEEAPGLQLAPHLHGCDGFFVAVLLRS